MANMSPPIPFDAGSMSAMTALAAIAASMALPPFSRTWVPARAASGWLDATIPNFDATIERPVTTGRRVTRGAESGSASWAWIALEPRADRARAIANDCGLMTGLGRGGV